MSDFTIAIFVHQDRRVYRNERIERRLDETPQEFGERVKQHIVEKLTRTAL